MIHDPVYRLRNDRLGDCPAHSAQPTAHIYQ